VNTVIATIFEIRV